MGGSSFKFEPSGFSFPIDYDKIHYPNGGTTKLEYNFWVGNRKIAVSSDGCPLEYREIEISKDGQSLKLYMVSEWLAVVRREADIAAVRFLKRNEIPPTYRNLRR